MKNILYVCGYKQCDTVESCELGFFAALRHQHKTLDGKDTYWYPVKITGVEQTTLKNAYTKVTMGKYCWQCGIEKGKMQVFDIPVFRKYTIGWCFECASKQVYVGSGWRFIKVKGDEQV